MDSQIGRGRFLLGDCFERMRDLADGSVDMVLCDLPYGTTACAWDAVLPFDKLWAEYRRVCKLSAVIVLTANQPFTSALVASNYAGFKYACAWNKVLPRGHLNAKKQPLRVLEDMLVFGAAGGTYNPQKTTGHRRKVANTVYEKGGDGSQVYGKERRNTHYDSTERYPTSLITFSNAAQNGKIHPTQKPVALFEYLIRTYTNEGETVLDNTAGSGTTAIAAENAGRRWVCIERDPDYYAKAVERVRTHTCEDLV